MIVKYEQLFPTASYLNCRIGFETEIPDDGDVDLELTTLKDIAMAFHMKNFPQFYKKDAPIYTGEEPVIAKEKSTKYTQTEILKQQMSTVTDLKVLETYKLLVKNNPELQDYYNHQENFIKNGL
jgi:hypothetical protein